MTEYFFVALCDQGGNVEFDWIVRLEVTNPAMITKADHDRAVEKAKGDNPGDIWDILSPFSHHIDWKAAEDVFPIATHDSDYNGT